MLKLRKILLSNSLYYFLLIFALAYSFCFYLFYQKKEYSLEENSFSLKIINYKIDGNKVSFELKGKEKLVSSYYFKEEKDLKEFKEFIEFGDFIEVKGTLEIPKNNTIPNLFNYKKYLKTKKINYILKIEDFKKIKENKNIFYSLKNFIYKKIEKQSSKEYLYAFILGDSYYINDEVNDSYIKNGVTHLFALSGMQVIILAVFIIFILKKLKINELTQYIIIFLVTLLLSFLTCFAPSIVRASLFFFLLGINKTFYFNIKTINILLLTLIILSIINPFIIFTLGFQLSFIVTFFLILTIKKINNSLKSCVYTCFISFIASFPLTIYNFYYFNIGSILINLFYVPYVSYIVYPFSLISFVFPFLNKIFLFLTNLMEKISLVFENINFLSLNFPKISFISLIILYLLLILIFKTKSKLYIVLILVFLIILYFKPYINNNTYFYFTDVSQGDSLLITTPNLNKTILIDTGGSIEYKKESWEIRNKNYSLSNDSLIPFYKSIGVKKIDYMFLTHGDQDHSGEANEIIENFKVNKVYINDGNLNNLEKSLKKYKKFEEDYIKIDNILIYNLNKNNESDENKNSLVLLLVVENFKFLLMGDAGVKEEKKILEKYNLKEIDFFKVGHHGSNTSSSEYFIDKIKPNTCIISVGKNNRFGHPKKSVVDRLNNYCKIYRTDINGSVEIKIKNNKKIIKTYSP